MAFAEDISDFFDFEEFAIVATITITASHKKSIKVIFDSPTQSATIYDTGIETDAPFLLCQTADLQDVKRGQMVKVNNRNYKIEKVADDGTGVSSVYVKT